MFEHPASKAKPRHMGFSAKTKLSMFPKVDASFFEWTTERELAPPWSTITKPNLDRSRPRFLVEKIVAPPKSQRVLAKLREESRRTRVHSGHSNDYHR